MAHEPTRDTVTPQTAALMAGLRGLLSTAGGYVETDAPTDLDTLLGRIDSTRKELMYQDDEGGKVQSAMDNESGYKEMAAGFEAILRDPQSRPVHAVFHELVGGLRFDGSTNRAMARYLKVLDQAFIRSGVVPATEYLFSGLK